MDVSEMVRFFREAAGMSQRELGEVLGLPGSRISEIEQGRRHLRFSEAAAIADACQLSDLQWLELRQAAIR